MESRSIDDWQDRLERHFESLKNARSASGFPIFALEHNLNDEELEKVSNLLRSECLLGRKLSSAWLLWVVYATESGYDYDGGEYWRSFEKKTPGWFPQDRYKISAWFKKFQNKYSGVLPSGPWANHFSIIAWPITHAILPRYLQRQFTRALYDLRRHVASQEELKSDAIGRLFSNHAYHASTRFQEFLQQEELTGRIVLALLGVAAAGGKAPIYPKALQRIVSDLDRFRNTREWLREAQRHVIDRFKGVGQGGRRQPNKSQTSGHDNVFDDTSYGLRPNIILRYSGDTIWSVVMEVPDFRGVASLNSEMRQFLKHTRCRLSGAIDTKPAEWLLSRNRKSVLKNWPLSQKPLVQFERAQKMLDHLLEAECQLSAGPLWLFRIYSDGTAREIIGLAVRPGYDYMVLTSENPPHPHAFMQKDRVDCSGVNSFRLLLPKALSTENIKWLRELGLELAQTIQVWPAGLPGRGWDGEGSSEWLTTEVPCFGVAHDSPVELFTFRLNNGVETTIEPGPPGEPLFVSLPQLPSGTYSLVVHAKRSPAEGEDEFPKELNGFLNLSVREPEPWVPGISSHQGLIVTIDPYDANLDLFSEGHTQVSVLGPKNHFVTANVSLETNDGKKIFSEDLNGTFELPITPDAWEIRVKKIFECDGYIMRCPEASVGCLTIEGGGLGRFVKRFEHDLLPVRWVLRSHQDKLLVRLVDDSGLEGSLPVVESYMFEMPVKNLLREADDFSTDYVVKPPGGLFIASHGGHQDAVVVSTLEAHSLRELGIRPSYSGLTDSSEEIVQALGVLDLWANSRLVGFLAGIRRQQVINRLLTVIYTILCGLKWGKAEANYQENPSSEYAIKDLERLVEKRIGFAAVLARDHQDMCSDQDLDHRYFELAQKFGITSDGDLCKFALRLAGQPHQVTKFYGEALLQLIDDIKTSPALLRGARLLKLKCGNFSMGEGQSAKLVD